jgi:predicted secreted acid phosphatase
LELKNDAEQGIFKQGEKVFKNRNYTVIQSPKELIGKKFVRSNIESTEVVCREGGMVYVLTPLKDRNQDSVTETLLKLGFEKVAQPETLLYEQVNAIVTLYQKEVQEGETIKLGKWGLLIY